MNWRKRVAKKTLTNLVLCFIGLCGINQTAWAEPARATLAILKLADQPQWCDASIQKLQQRITELEKRPIKANANAAPVLAEWDAFMAMFEDLTNPISLYRNVYPDAKFRQAADDCIVKMEQLQTDLY